MSSFFIFLIFIILLLIPAVQDFMWREVYSVTIFPPYVALIYFNLHDIPVLIYAIAGGLLMGILLGKRMEFWADKLSVPLLFTFIPGLGIAVISYLIMTAVLYFKKAKSYPLVGLIDASVAISLVFAMFNITLSL